MTEVPNPHTVHGWLDYMTVKGMSNRPVDLDGTDLLESETYADPLDMKPERVALGAILCVRAYQRAKRKLNDQGAVLSRPSFTDLTRLPLPHELRLGRFIQKSEHIGAAFNQAMKDSVLEDEAYLQTQPADFPAAAVYHRLETILEPHREDYLKSPKVQALIQEFGHPSLTSAVVYIGSEVLPENVETLLHAIVQGHLERFGRMPHLPTILKVALNSYESFILPVASINRADGRNLIRLQQLGLVADKLHIDRAEISTDVIRLLRGQERVGRARTTRCAFLASTKDMQMFLDEPADFEDPLRDAFNLYMGFLAA